MNTLGESLRGDDRTIAALLFDATATGDWHLLEHFMLGSLDNDALPREEKTTGL